MMVRLYLMRMHVNANSLGRCPPYCVHDKAMSDQDPADLLAFSYTARDFGIKNLCLVEVDAEDDVHKTLAEKPDVVPLHDGAQTLTADELDNSPRM